VSQREGVRAMRSGRGGSDRMRMWQNVPKTRAPRASEASAAMTRFMGDFGHAKLRGPLCALYKAVERLLPKPSPWPPKP
jgi:hypothetical protein